MKTQFLTLSCLLAIAGWTPPSSATVLFQHVGATDPAAEGFSTLSFLNASTQTPLSNDFGRAAWSISNGTAASQFGYGSAPFTVAQSADVAARGFVLRFEARVLQGVVPAIYDANSHLTMANAVVNYGGRRFEIDLGRDVGGHTVVVLPTSIDNGGPGAAIRSFGSAIVLADTPSSYHSYELVFEPTTALSRLSIDGVDQGLTYAGHTSFVGTSAVTFGAFSGGTANFASLQLTVADPPVGVGSPAALVLLLAGLGSLATLRAR